MTALCGSASGKGTCGGGSSLQAAGRAPVSRVWIFVGPALEKAGRGIN